MYTQKKKIPQNKGKVEEGNWKQVGLHVKKGIFQIIVKR